MKTSTTYRTTNAKSTAWEASIVALAVSAFDRLSDQFGWISGTGIDETAVIAATVAAVSWLKTIILGRLAKVDVPSEVADHWTQANKGG